MTEQEYLQTYNAKAFDSPLLSIDAVLFSYHDKQLKVLLVKRSNHPEKGKWGLPGGFVDQTKDRNLEDTVVRKLREKTGVTPPYLEQLETIGNSHRDRRGWSVTVCYTALMSYQKCQVYVDAVSDAQWVETNKLTELELAFDHAHIIEIGRERLKQKALYTIVPAFSLSETFTFSELQHVHETLIGKPIQKKSFRRRIEQADLLIDTGEKRSETGRPAILYRVKPSAGNHTFLRNLEL